MTDINKLMAQALVEQGYALGYDCNPYRLTPEYVAIVRNIELPVDVDPFSDTLEGYRQLFALVDWSYSHKVPAGKYTNSFYSSTLWYESEFYVGTTNSYIDWIRRRVKWCFEQMITK